MAGLAVLFCVGCQKSETPAPPTESGVPEQAVQKPSMQEEPSMQEKPSIQETVTNTAEAAKKVVSDANAKAQEILTQAQNLVGEKKYEEAGSLLQKLGDFQLTPEQQKMLDDLKATIQKAMESDAVKQGTKAIGNMLQGGQ